MKKILFLSSRIRAGYYGTEKFLEYLLMGLPKEWDKSFIGYDKPINDIFRKQGLYNQTFIGGFEPDGPKKKLLIPFSILTGLTEFILFLPRFLRSDLVFFPASIMAETFFVGPYLKLFLNKKFISVIHKNECPDHIAYNPLFFLYRYVLNNGVQVFVSNSQKKQWEAKKATTKDSRVIYNGVTCNQYIPKLAKNDQSITLGFIGRIHYDKGLDVLAKSLEILNPNQKITLKIAGEGEDYNSIKPLFDKINNSNIVIEWVGYISNTTEFFSTLDLLVYPSQKEGFALVPLEAWERGLPVLTSDIDPFVEAKSFTNNLEKTLIFTKNDHNSLVEKIRYYIANKEQFDQSHSIFLHNVIEQNFSLNIMCENYKKLIEELTIK